MTTQVSTDLMPRGSDTLVTMKIAAILCRSSLVILVLSLLSYNTVAHSDVGKAGMSLRLATEYWRTNDSEKLDDLRDVQMIGGAIEGYAGTKFVGFFAHVDAYVGVGLQGGVAYRLSALPVGLSLYDRRHIASMSVATGVMVQGTTAHEPIGVQLPLRISIDLELGYLHANAWLTNGIALVESHHNGSANSFVGDEMQVALVLRAGAGQVPEIGTGEMTTGKGFFVGVLYAERLSTHFWGLTLGWAMTMHGARNPHGGPARHVNALRIAPDSTSSGQP